MPGVDTGETGEIDHVEAEAENGAHDGPSSGGRASAGTWPSSPGSPVLIGPAAPHRIVSETSR
jgi:hypothetical protein